MGLSGLNRPSPARITAFASTAKDVKGSNANCKLLRMPRRVDSSGFPCGYAPPQFAFLLNVDGYRKKPLDDFRVGSQVQRGLGRAE